MKKRISGALLLAVLSTLTACAVGPDYQRPELATPAQFKELHGWKIAEPRDEAPRGKWWEAYGDPQLGALLAQIDLSNQNVAAAAAQYRQAQAALSGARAGYLPTISASLSANRGLAAANDTSTSNTNTIRDTDRLALSLSWEADVWGRIGRNVEAGTASAEASAADLQAALLSARATLLQSYIQLRVNDAQRRLLEDTVKAYQRSLEITRNRYAAGVAGRIDVAQAETQLKSTQAQALDLGVQRAQLEHAIATLIGQAASDFSLPPHDSLPGMSTLQTLPTLPPVPTALPASLLERRPDIAAAERRMAAANAQIGVAQAAFFPALSFSASGGYQDSGLSQLLSLPNRFWSLGPTLALTLFDAGARSAQKEQAVAAYDKSVATYRQTVLTAFQEVEDSLGALRILAEEAAVQREATVFAAESLRLTENQYQSGTVGYLNVISAQTTALAAERSSLDIAGRRLLASVALMKALGGAW